MKVQMNAYRVADSIPRFDELENPTDLAGASTSHETVGTVAGIAVCAVFIYLDVGELAESEENAGE